MDPKELKAIIECLLFVSPQPLELKRLEEIIGGGVDTHTIRVMINQLQEEYGKEDRGIQIVEIAGGYRMNTRREYSPWVKRLFNTKLHFRLSRSALETLSIIAYKQPIMRVEVEAIRGVSVEWALHTLLEKNLIKIVGRSEQPGRPLQYGTTDDFMVYFGLKDLTELPQLKEFKDIIQTEDILAEPIEQASEEM
ncbi:MAG: SMC-Scp complex subunit ScpB [bacterium]|nr:SMC-Scp complex subunit ScpB [bacterium]